MNRVHARYIAEAIKNESAFHPLHSITLALHCMLILSRVNSHFRCELGMTGIVLQLVNNLRSMQMIPGWNKVYIVREKSFSDSCRGGPTSSL